MVQRSRNKEKPPTFTEDQIDKWLQKTDLSRLKNLDFTPFQFKKLEEKLIEESYQKSQETLPVTLRLPKNLIKKLKLLAMQQGIAYQTLIKLLLNERSNHLLSGHP